jgi:hypothetical protein
MNKCTPVCFDNFIEFGLDLRGDARLEYLGETFISSINHFIADDTARHRCIFLLWKFCFLLLTDCLKVVGWFSPARESDYYG